MDIIRIPFERPEPIPHQPENWLISDEPWQLIRRGFAQDLAPLLRSSTVATPALLGDRSNRIPVERFEKRPAGASLALIQPSDLTWSIEKTPENPRKPRALFRLGQTSYSLPVTDRAYIDHLRSLPLGTHRSEAAGIHPSSRILLSVSLSEPFEGFCYKLACAIVPLPPGLVTTPETPDKRENAAAIIDALARGTDPFTGDLLPQNTPFCNPDTLQALREAAATLRATLAPGKECTAARIRNWWRSLAR